MESNTGFSSGEDDFDFTYFQNKMDDIYQGLATETDSSDEDGADVICFKKQKIRTTDSESGSDSDNIQEPENSGWFEVTDSKDTPPRITFIPGEKPAGVLATLNMTEPVDFLKLFFTNDLINEIVTETNNYAKKKLEGKTQTPNSIWRKWHDVTHEEFWAFIAVIINMGTMPLVNIQEYWSTNDASHIPFYSNTFTRDRFSQIFWMLHLKTISTPTGNRKTRLQLVSCYLDYINSKLLDYFLPGENICVDESVIKVKGKVSFISCNPKELTRNDIRIYTLADSETGYICGILPYYGAFTTEQMIRPDLPVSTRIPLQLYKMLLSKIPGAQGHHMFTDRCYTSYTLAQELYRMKCHLTGIVQRNGRWFPNAIRKPKFHKRPIIAYRKNNTLILSWKDKRILTLLSNWDNAEMTSVKSISRGDIEISIKKPNVLLNYTKFMGGIEQANQYASRYCFMRQNLKWWRKLFFWGLEICLINSYILYKLVKTQRNERQCTRSQYIKKLVSQLRGDFRQVRDHASTSTSSYDEIRLDGKLHVLQTGTKKDCKVCSHRNKPGGRHETTHFCDTCPDKPRMHLGDCFINYHTKKKYKL